MILTESNMSNNYIKFMKQDEFKVSIYRFMKQDESDVSEIRFMKQDGSKKCQMNIDS